MNIVSALVTATVLNWIYMKHEFYIIYRYITKNVTLMA